MTLEGFNGPFSSITAVDIQGDKLEVPIPFVLDLERVGFARFVVQYLEVYCVAGVFETSHDTVISGEAVAVVPWLKWFDEDCIGFNVVGQHDVVIAAKGTDRELAHVICIQLDERIDLGVDLVGIYGWELTGDVRKRCLFWFRGAHSLPSLGKVSFLIFDWHRAVFCGICTSET